MVTFVLPSGKNNNNDNNNNDEDDEDGIPGRTFRVTPDPQKGSSHHPFVVTGENNTITVDERLDSCITTDMSSPQDGTAHRDDNIMMDDPRPTSSHDDMDGWEEWLGRTMTGIESSSGTTTTTLEAYLAAKQIRYAAKQAFEDAIEMSLEGLNQAMTVELIQDTVGVVYQEQSERLEDIESNILLTIQSNHDRRTSSLELLEEANHRWECQYKTLRNRIWNEKDSNSEIHQTNATLDNEEGRQEEYPTKVFEGHHDGSNESSSPITTSTKHEMKWDEIMDHHPSRESMMSFLNARQEHQDTNETFHHALDEIHAGLKDDMNSIMIVVEKFYDEMESKFETMERDIEYHLMSNSRRRLDLENRLQDAKTKSQGYFDSLLSRLSGVTTNTLG